jgi:hypothetical protein
MDRSERAPPTDERASARRTLVVRDGDKVLISVPVGKGSALAVPLRVDQLPCEGARLVVRLASDTAPCPGCVDEGLAAACAVRGGLDAAGILGAVRDATDRCAEVSRLDPAHGAPPSSIPPRSGGSLRLAPPAGPHVDAGSTPAEGGEVDLLLII